MGRIEWGSAGGPTDTRYSVHPHVCGEHVVKTTRNQQENFLQSFHSLSFANPRQQMRSRRVF